MRKVIISSVLALSLIAVPSFAGNSNQSGQSSQSSQSGQSSQCGQSSQSGQSSQASQANHGGCHKKSFLKKLKKSVVKGFKAGKKAGTKAFDAAQNKVMDAGVSVKKAVTGKKCKTFVKGHYDKNGSHTKGHCRNTCNKPCKR